MHERRARALGEKEQIGTRRGRGGEGKETAFGSKETETTATQATKSLIVDTI